MAGLTEVVLFSVGGVEDAEVSLVVVGVSSSCSCVDVDSVL